MNTAYQPVGAILWNWFELPKRPDDNLVLGWTLFVPVLILVIGTALLAWRWSGRQSALVKVLVRSFYLAFFLSPTLVGAGGPTGAFFLPGPAFLMVAFAQWELRLRLGIVPILIGWLVIGLIYAACWNHDERK